MSAYLDKSQGVGFYFGNATKELADRLPKETVLDLKQNEISLQSLNEKIDSIFETLAVVEQKNSELSFFVSDIAKLLK